MLAVVDIAGGRDVLLDFGRGLTSSGAGAGARVLKSMGSMGPVGPAAATKRGRKSAKLAKASCLACRNRTSFPNPSLLCAVSRSSPALLVTRSCESPKKSAFTSCASASFSASKAAIASRSRYFSCAIRFVVCPPVIDWYSSASRWSPGREHRALVVRVEVEPLDSACTARREFQRQSLGLAAWRACGHPPILT